MKECIRRIFPRTFVLLRSIKDQLVIEARTIKTIGVRGIIAAFTRKESWESALPVQSIRRVSLSGVTFSDLEELLAPIEITRSGAHSVYLPPDVWATSPLASLQYDYPAGCGLKLMKRLGGVDTPYVTPEHGGAVLQYFLATHRHQILVMNYLHIAGLSPRLFDLLEIDGGEAICVAFVVEHAPGGAPPNSACRERIQALRELVSSGHLQLINWNGFEDRDFQCPDCNGNLLLNVNGEPVYVDTQNFRVADYGRTLTALAHEAQATSHFGDRAHLLGGDYLYQAVPGVAMPAKRDPDRRMVTLISMLSTAGVTLEGRPVLDIGCNLGLMGAQYLKNGALWLHGWDMPEIVEYSRRILLAIGCTRFSLTGTKLGAETELSRDIPTFLRPHMERAVISYLAIRGHVGWLPSLGTLQWSHMIYEGHESEDTTASRALIAEFARSVPVEIVAEQVISDGTSKPRYVAMLTRMD